MQSCDGHNAPAVDAALGTAKAVTDKPSLIALKTLIGFGAPTKAGSHHCHGSPLGKTEADGAKAAFGSTLPAFEVPADLAGERRAIGSRGEAEREAWNARLASRPEGDRAEFARRVARTLPATYDRALGAARAALFAASKSVATRKASQMALEALAPDLPELIGGSADLTGSNLTRVPAVDDQFTRTHPGNYVGYGVREFGMAAAMNGISVHGGLIPYGGTFLVFSDYARNAIRLSALMGVGTIYVMTHDSIGLGEDGPTHQPVEHLASLRAIPGLSVFRPGDAVEALECWDLALRSRHAPSLLALSRQGVPQLRLDPSSDNLSAKGAYVLRQFGEGRDITLIATGTEVSLAVEAAAELHQRGLSVAVVSMPCWELFDAQPKAYREETLGTAPRIAIEAASKFGWTRYVRCEEDVIGMISFGASAPAESLYAHFGITKEAICARAEELAV